jgi:hypothetical protein
MGQPTESGYGLNDVRSKTNSGADKIFLLSTSSKTGSGAHSASYPMATRGSFLVGKERGA